jgi:predicted N-acyltransferase
MWVQEKSLLSVIDCQDRARWNSLIDGFSEQDIYFSHEYFMSSLLLDQGEAVLFFFRNGKGKVAYPVIKRKILNGANMELWDITTPYGYGGPLVSADGDTQALLLEFREAVGEYCAANRIVSEFVRFHPLLDNQQGLERSMEIVHANDTVTIGLQEGGDLLVRIPGKNRNMIRKAMKNGIEIKKISIEENLEEFILIYYATMRRNDAAAFYFFTEAYFRKTIELFGEDIHLFGAFLDGKMISATLILTRGKFMHYHLSGSLDGYRNLGANNLLLFKIAEWGQERGVRNFHLGGGYSGQEDSLYRFKKTFTAARPSEFHIGKKIHNPNLYQMLVLEKGFEEASGFFPLYRSTN